MNKNGFDKISEDVTFDDGEDAYSSIHYYHLRDITQKIKNKVMTQDKKVLNANGVLFALYVAKQSNKNHDEIIKLFNKED